MRDETEKYKTFTRRSIVLCGLKISLMLCIASRYYYLQVLKSDKYKLLSDKNRIKVTVIPPFRGLIFDRNRDVLALNKKFYRLVLHDHEIKNAIKRIENLNQIFGKKRFDDSKKTLDRKLKQKKLGSPLVLGSHLTWEEISKIEVNKDLLPGVEVDIGQERFYPYAENLSHVLGYISSPAIEEVRRSSLPNFQDFKIGKNGIEKTENEKLSGFPGIKKVEVDAYGYYIRNISADDSISGNDITISINSSIQNSVAELMRGKNGAVVLLDIKSGEVLAMHSTPSYDPNLFIGGISHSHWNKFLKNPNHPLSNKSISMIYPAGSTFKMVTALAALKLGVGYGHVTDCTGSKKIGTQTFRCWKKGGHGKVNFKLAIAQSCNVFFYEMAQMVGIANIARIAGHLGLGQKTGIELPSEASGLIPNKAWKKSQYNKEWYVGDTVNTAIGQGYVNVTPLQLALMSARIASGKIINPTLFCSDDRQFADLDIEQKHLQFLRESLNGVFNSAIGTGRFLKIKNFPIVGKTGTAQVVSMDNKAKKGRKFDDHSIFTGYGPYKEPKYALATLIENGRWGSVSAAPLARKIFLQLMKLSA